MENNNSCAECVVVKAVSECLSDKRDPINFSHIDLNQINRELKYIIDMDKILDDESKLIFDSVNKHNLILLTTILSQMTAHLESLEISRPKVNAFIAEKRANCDLSKKLFPIYWEMKNNSQ